MRKRRDQSLRKSERGSCGGKSVFDAKKFPAPNLIAFMFFGYLLRAFKKDQDPPSNEIPNMANESFLNLLEKTPPSLLLAFQGPCVLLKVIEAPIFSSPSPPPL